jgi:hypothetical protein
MAKQSAAIKYGSLRPTRLSTGCNATQDRISTIAEIVNDTECIYINEKHSSKSLTIRIKTPSISTL